jgi:transcriptional regulator with XRE-family HTH domain
MTAIERPDWADRMRAALDSAGLTEADLAALLGETHETVARWLDGDEEMSGPAFLLALAIVRDKTDVSPYWIVTGQPVPASDQRLN